MARVRRSPLGPPGAGAGGAYTAGAAGAPLTAGAPNVAGANTGGGGAGGGTGYACNGVKPTAPLITEFTNLTASGTDFTFTDGIPGGTYSYQTGHLTLSATTDMALNVKGTVSDNDGFGIYFSSCTDASAYTGVSFNIKGNVGSSGKVTFRVQTTPPPRPTRLA